MTTPIVSTIVIGETVGSGTQTIICGGIASNTNITDTGLQDVYPCGITSNTNISGGRQRVYSGGTANNTNINGGGQYISGGTVNATTINSGIQYVTNFFELSGSASGTANSTTINNTGIQKVMSSTATITTINSGGVQSVWQGTANSTTINGGYQKITAYSTANNTTINSGGSQIVSYTCTANSTTINSGGYQEISASVANSTIINFGGVQYIGGTAGLAIRGLASQSIVQSGGTIMIGNGGLATDSLVHDGGTIMIGNGGLATDLLVHDGGTLIIGNGGVVKDFTMSSGGVIGWDFNAIFSGTSNGITVVSSCGSNSYNMYLNNAKQFVLSGFTANSATINSGGEQDVSSGGMVTNTTINYGGYQVIHGSATSTTINYGGYQVIYGSATSTTINSGGSQKLVGATVTNTTINSGGIQGIYGFTTATSTTINSGGVQYIRGQFDVYNGLFLGSATSTIINFGGSQIVSDCGIATNTTINSGGIQYVLGHEIFDPYVLYGSATNTTINSGGSQVVSAFGKSINTIINSGGFQAVELGGIISGTMIIAGGHVVLEDASAITSRTTICYKLTNTSTNDSLLTVNGGTLNGGILGANSASYSIDLNNTASGTYILANGTDLSKMNSNNFIVNYNSQNINLKIGCSYIFTDGNKLSLHIDDSTRDQLTAVFSDAVNAPNGLNKIVTMQTVMLDWADSNDASGIKQYDIQVDNNVDFSSPEYAASTIASVATINSLSDGIYYWKVRTQDNAGNYSEWTNGSSFTVDITAPSAPATLTRTVTGNSVALDWADTTDAISGVKQYEFQIDNNSDFSSNEKSGTAVTSNATATGLADGNYYWCVRTQDNSGNYSTWVSGSGFMVDITAPSVPAILIRTVTGNTVTLDWADSTDATSGVKQYEYQVDNNADFSSNEKSGIATVSNASVSGIADGNYYWRVRTQDNSGNYSTWVSGSSFMVDITAPSIPATLSKTVVGNNVALDWANATDATSGVKQYQVQLDKNADFSSPDYTASPVTSAVNFNGLADGTFYWRVRTQDNAENYSGWSVGSSFVSDIAGNNAGAMLLSTPSTTGWVGLNDQADYYKLNMTNAGMLKLGLTGLSGDANLSLLDAKGKVLKTSANRGTANESITNYLLLSGTYYVNIAPARGVNSASYTLTHAETYFPVDKAPNTWQTAKDIATLDNWVGYGDPADYYKLTMTNAGTLTLGLTGLNGDSNLSLLDSKGKVLKTSANKGNTAEAIADFALLAGTYYVNVAPVTGVNSAAYTLTHAEKYCPIDKAQNTWQTAKDISTLDNWVGFGDPADYYKLTMTNAGTLTLGLTGLNGDSNLSLLDGTGKVLKTSANKGNTGEAITDFALLAGTYYVNVAPVTGVNSAAYTLTHVEKYCPIDKAQNTWQTAKDIATLDNWVGFGDPADCYKLAMSKNGTLALNLTGLTGDANLSLLDSKGKVLKTSANKLNASEAITADLAAGTYYVNVAPVKGVNKADYTLAHAENYFPDDTALNTFALSRQITASGSVNEWLGFGDKDDYYKFELKNATTAVLNLNGITSDVNLYLYDGKNKQLAVSAKTGNTAESITKQLGIGIYYVKATLAGKANTSYALNFNIDPAAFKSGSLQLFSASSQLTGSSDSAFSADPLKKNQGMLAS